MRLLQPLTPDPRAPLVRIHPLAKLACAGIVLVVLFVSVDLLSGAAILLLEIALLPFSGLPLRAVARRTWPLLLAVALIGLGNALVAQPRGTLLAQFGPLHLGTAALLSGAGLGLRLAAIAFAGVLALATTDPTDLADALMQQLRVSPRLALGTLAALRLLPVLAEEWQTIGLARRARGVGTGGGPLARARLFAAQLLALLVGAVRRATRLAQAMEARGLGSRACRTVARPRPVRRLDGLAVAATAAIGMVLVAAGIALGTWRSILS